MQSSSKRQSRRLLNRDGQSISRQGSLDTPPEDGPQEMQEGAHSQSASSSKAVNGTIVKESSSKAPLTSQGEKSIEDDINKNKRITTEPSISIRIKRPKRQIKEEINVEKRDDDDQTKLEPDSRQATFIKPSLITSPSSSSLLYPSVTAEADPVQKAYGQVDIHSQGNISTIASEQKDTTTQSPFIFKSLPQPAVLPSVFDCSQCSSSQLYTTAAVDPLQQILPGSYTASDLLPSPFYPNTDTVQFQSGSNLQSAYRDHPTGIDTERYQNQVALTSDSYQRSSCYQPFPPFEPWKPLVTTAPQLTFPPLPIPNSNYCCSGQEEMPPVTRSRRQRSTAEEARVNFDNVNEALISNVSQEDHPMNNDAGVASQRPRRSTSRPLSRSATPTPASRVLKAATKKSPKKSKRDEKKPQRCAVACEECRDFKRKCSGTLPCQLCVSRHKPERCRYQGGAMAKGRQLMSSLKAEEEEEETEEEKESSTKVRRKKIQETSKTQAVEKNKKKTKILTSPRFHGNRIPPTIQSDKTIDKDQGQNLNVSEGGCDLHNDADDMETSADTAFEFEEEEDTAGTQSNNCAAGCTTPSHLPLAPMCSAPAVTSYAMSTGRVHSSSMSSARPPPIPYFERVGTGAQTPSRLAQAPFRRTSWGTSDEYHHRHHAVNGHLSSPPLSSQNQHWLVPRSASALGTFPGSIQFRSSPPANHFHTSSSSLPCLHASPTRIEVGPSSSHLPNEKHQFPPGEHVQVRAKGGEGYAAGTSKESTSYHHSKSKSGLDSLAIAVDLKISKSD